MRMGRVFVTLKVVAIFFCTFEVVVCEENETTNIETSLRQALFKSYDRYRKPTKLSLKQLSVSINLYIFSLPKLDIKKQTLHAVNWLLYSWTDEYLRWNSSDFSYIDFLRLPADKVWIPNVCNMQEISGRRCLTYDSVKDSRSEAIIHSSGGVYLSEAFDSIILCKFDVTKFPLDTQTCIFSFSLPIGKFQNVDLKVNGSSYESNYFIGNEEWDLLSTSIQGVHGMLDMKIVLKRRPLFIILTVALPIIALSIMNAFCFLLPIESGEKMGMSVALFLTFGVFGSIISDTMPQNAANISWFMVYVTTQILLSGLTVIMETVVLHMYYMDVGISGTANFNKADDVQHGTTNKPDQAFVCNAGFSDVKWKIRAKKLDRTMLIFNVCANVTSFFVCILSILN